MAHVSSEGDRTIDNGPLLPGGLQPPEGLASAILELFDITDTDIIYGVEERSVLGTTPILRQLIRNLTRHVETDEFRNAIGDLVRNGLLIETPAPQHERTYVHKYGLPGPSDHFYVSTPLGRKGARLCATQHRRRWAVWGLGDDRLADKVILTVGISHGDTPFEEIDAACCTTPTQAVHRATSDCIHFGLIQQSKDPKKCNLTLVGESRYAALKQEFYASREFDESEKAARSATQVAKEASAFGKWRVLGELGHGGQGSTKRVICEEDQTQGVLKILLEKHRENEESEAEGLARLRREIETMRKISHPCVLKFLDSRTDGLNPWFVTEYMPFQSLEKHLPAYRGDVWRCLRVARDVAVGLEAVHNENMVHRDVKPDNILLRDLDHVVLGDFGLIHTTDATVVTKSGERVGANWYRPPEAEGGRIEPTPAFDVYSLGKVIWKMLTGGAPPFSREHFRGPDSDITKVLNRSDLELVNDLLSKMIVEARDARLQSMADVIAAIDQVLVKCFGAGAGQFCRICGANRSQSVVTVEQPSPLDMRYQENQVMVQFRPKAELCRTCGDIQWHSPEIRNKWKPTKNPIPSFTWTDPLST